MALLPEDPALRKSIPLYSGVIAYFPAALVEIAKRSKLGNDTHSPGQPMRWVRDKSNDHLDCAMRHLAEGDLTGAAWRLLAALQLKCEADGSPIAPGALIDSYDPVAAEWQDSRGGPANPINQSDEE